jgi:hypothetical protein
MERSRRTAKVIDYNDGTSSEEDAIYEDCSSDEEMNTSNESKSEESEVRDRGQRDPGFIHYLPLQ